MATLEQIREQTTPAQLLEGQAQHIGIAILMTAGAVALLDQPAEAPRLLGLTARSWAIVSIAFALLHQIVVAAVFRLQLHYGTMSRMFGTRDMQVWRGIFLPLLVSRPLTVLLVALADPVPITGARLPEVLAGVALLGVAAWAIHSTVVHFTLPRALGGDHFRQEIADMPMVDKGAFAVTPNAMYGLAFLGLWGIALALGSWNALVVALFQHAYIWVHMYCTEAPDMRRLYTAA